MGQSLRILSANLMNGGADPTAFANLVAALAVDVLAVQEVTGEQAEPLARQFEHGEIEPHPGYVGMGLLARHAVAIERVEMCWGFAQTVHLSGSPWRERGQGVEITNLHMAAPHMLDPLPGPWLRWRQVRELGRYLTHADTRDDFCACRRDAQNRCESTSSSSATNVRNGAGAPLRPGAENLRPRPALPRLLVGDFNATPYWPLYRRISSQFTDAALAVANNTGVSPRATWGPFPGGPKLLRIDHGFVRGLRVEGFEVFEVEGSDHSAVVMDLTLPDSSIDR